MADPVLDEARLAAEIQRLKAEFPKTRELYREVCALLFFRFGVTPTANRLYQLVRRGSMGTPTTVLAEFWSELREKSRVRIEHPDLPNELRGAAGELVATLWTQAQTVAQAALGGLRADVELQQRDAQQAVSAVEADLARTETALEQRTTALLSAQVRIHELEQALAAGEATRAALDSEIARLQQEGGVRERALADARTDFAAERDKLRTSVDLAQTRLETAEQRATCEIDRGRTDIQALQKQLGDLRHHAGMLEGQLEAMRSANAAYARELEAWREKVGLAAGGPARAAHTAARTRATTGAAAGKTARGTRKGRSAGTSGSRSGS